MLSRILLLATLFVYAKTSVAQARDEAAFNLEIGHHVQFGSPKGLEYVINRYNETRNYLTQEMGKLNNLDGITISMGANIGYGYMDVGFNTRKNRTYALGTVNNQTMRRDLKIQANALYIGFGLDLPIEEDLSVVFGARAEFAFPSIKSRVGTPDEIKNEEWDLLESGTYGSVALFAKFVISFVNIEPYFSFGNKDSFNMAWLNKDLNPNTAANDHQELPFNYRSMGLRITFSTINIAD